MNGFVTKAERTLLRLPLQFFGSDGTGDGGADSAADNGAGNTAGADKNTDPAAQTKENTSLSSDDIKKLIQSTVDSRTADLGKTIADLKKENAELKKANMTAEQLAQADKEEFEKQKAEVELQKRQIYAQRVVANAGYGDNVDAVVDMVLGESDEVTEKRLQNFKTLVDKLVSERVQKTFKANGRVPNGGNADGDDKDKKPNIAAELGKKRAETLKQSNDILKHYYGGNK